METGYNKTKLTGQSRCQRRGGVGEMGEGGEKAQTSSYRVNYVLKVCAQRREYRYQHCNSYFW